MITGGAGYIGSHAVKVLKNYYRVIVLDNLSTGFIEAVPTDVIFYQGSTHDEEYIISILKAEKVDAVMHFAAFSLVGESVANPLKYYHNNIEGTRVLLSAMRKVNVNAFIFSSTAAVYGVQEVMPINEDALLMPVNPYGITKKTIEDMLKDLHQSDSSFNYISLRYFNVAGSSFDGSIGENHDPETHLIPNLIKAAFNHQPCYIFGDDYNTHDGSAIRDYIHVIDLVDAHHKALNYVIEHKKSNVFNLGSSKGYSVFEVVNAVEKTLKLTLNKIVKERRLGDPERLVASYKKAKEVLNWEPQHDVFTMVQTAALYESKKQDAK